MLKDEGLAESIVLPSTVLAERYEIREILTGVRQSDEIVGSIDSFSKTSLSWSEFHDRTVGSELTDFQEHLITNSGYKFAYNFAYNFGYNFERHLKYFLGKNL